MIFFAVEAHRTDAVIKKNLHYAYTNTECMYTQYMHKK